MNKKLIFIVAILLTLSIIPFASAASAQQNSLNGLNINYDNENGGGASFIIGFLVGSFNSMAMIMVTMPIYNNQVSIFTIFMTWILLFSLLWAATTASGTMTLFQGSDTKGAKKGFVISVSLLLTFATPIVGMINDFLNTWMNVFWILSLIVIIWILAKVLTRGFVHGQKYGANTRKIWNEAKGISNEENVISNRLSREKNGLKELDNLTKVETVTAHNFIEILYKLRNAISKVMNAEGEEVQKEIKRVTDYFSAILKYEGVQNETLKRVKSFRNLLNKDNIKIFEELKIADLDEKKIESELSKTTNERFNVKTAEEFIDKAERDSRTIQESIKIIDNLNIREEADESKANSLTRTLRGNLSAVPPEYTTALNTIRDLIDIVESEVKILKIVRTEEEKIERILKLEYHDILDAAKETSS